MRLDLGDEAIFDDADCGALLRGNLSGSIRSYTAKELLSVGWYMSLMGSLWDCLRLELSHFLTKGSQDES